MNKNIKAIITFYFIILISLAISAGGLMLVNQEYALIYLATAITAIPLLNIITIIYFMKKKSK